MNYYVSTLLLFFNGVFGSLRIKGQIGTMSQLPKFAVRPDTFNRDVESALNNASSPRKVKKMQKIETRSKWKVYFFLGTVLCLIMGYLFKGHETVISRGFPHIENRIMDKFLHNMVNGFLSPANFLIYGPKGIGKSYFTNKLVSEYPRPVISFDFSNLHENSSIKSLIRMISDSVLYSLYKYRSDQTLKFQAKNILATLEGVSYLLGRKPITLPVFNLKDPYLEQVYFNLDSIIMSYEFDMVNSFECFFRGISNLFKGTGLAFIVRGCSFSGFSKEKVDIISLFIKIMYQSTLRNRFYSVTESNDDFWFLHPNNTVFAKAIAIRIPDFDLEAAKLSLKSSSSRLTQSEIVQLYEFFGGNPMAFSQILHLMNHDKGFAESSKILEKQFLFEAKRSIISYHGNQSELNNIIKSLSESLEKKCLWQLETEYYLLRNHIICFNNQTHYSFCFPMFYKYLFQ